jgi:hypothetical protein
MFVFDLLAGMLVGGLPSSPPGRRGPEDAAEQITGIVGTVALPAIGFCLVLFAGLVDPLIALILLPAACLAIAICLCLLLQTSTAWTLRVALGSLMFSFVFCGAGWLMAVFFGFFRAF